MQCHYCEADADVTVEKGGVVVGLCEEDFRARLEELNDAEALEDLREQLDIDRPE